MKALELKEFKISRSKPNTHNRLVPHDEEHNGKLI